MILVPHLLLALLVVAKAANPSNQSELDGKVADQAAFDGADPCTFLDKIPGDAGPGYVGVNGTRWCRSIAVEEYRLCPRRAPGDIACQATLAPLATVDDLRRALAGKHVVFMGDSRVRYQYMDLVDALVHGDFMKCQDYWYPGNLSRCFEVDERLQGQPWATWYAQSNAEFNDKASNSSELCDCFRPPKFTAENTYENRFFRQHSAYGVIRVTYLENFVDMVRFHPGFPPRGYHGRAPCKAGGCNTATNHVFNTEDTIANVLPRLNATHVFAQTGWKQDDIGCALAEIERTRGIRGFYITHTNEALSATPKLGCGLNSSRVLDRLAATTGPYPSYWFWDGLHVLSILNAHYNGLLLHAIQE